MNTNRNQQKKKRCLGIHALYLFFLSPIFLLITLIMGVNNHEDTHAIIEENFGLKLEAISFVTAAFLSGEPFLETRIERYEVGALAFIPESNRLIGFDRRKRQLLEIDPTHGAATAIRTALEIPITDLAYDSNRAALWAIDTASRLYQFPLNEHSPPEYIQPLSGSPTAIAYHPDLDRIYLWSNGLLQLDIDLGKTTRLSQTDLPEVIALTYSSTSNQIAALSHDPYRLYWIDPQTGTIQSQQDLSYCLPPLPEDPTPMPKERLWQALQYDRMIQSENPDTIQQANQLSFQIAQNIHQARIAADADSPPPRIENLAGITAHPEPKSLLTSSTSLYRIDLSSNCVLPQGWFPGYFGELDPATLTLLSPLRRIAQKLDLTYLYTFYRMPDAGLLDIVYSLDANIDADHSFPGDPDTFPEDSLFDMYGRIYLGELYLSEIVEWEEWGLIKTGYAPILRRDGTIEQIVGADIDVSIIESHTRIHLLQTVVLALLLFLFTLLVTFYVTRKMIQPIADLNETALIVAAGEYGKQTPVSGSLEFRALCEAFNQYSLTLKQAADKRLFDNQILNYQTSRAELIRHLNRISQSFSQPDTHHCHIQSLDPNPDRVPVSHATECEGGWVAWSGHADENPIHALQVQTDTAWIVRSLFKEKPDPWNHALPYLQKLHTDSIHAFFFLNRLDSSLSVLNQAAFSILHIQSASVTILQASPEQRCALNPGDVVMAAPAACLDPLQTLLQTHSLWNADDDALQRFFQLLESSIHHNRQEPGTPSDILLFRLGKS